MKTQIVFFNSIATSLLFLIVSLSIGACSKDDIEIATEDDLRQEISIGDYYLLQESIDQLPYLDKVGVFFADSTGTKVRFDVEVEDLSISGKQGMIKYDVFLQGDRVDYIFRGEDQTVHLTNDSLVLSFKIVLEAFPYREDPESRAVADILTVWLEKFDDPTSRLSVLRHVTNSRTYPRFTASVSTDEVLVLGRSFTEIYTTSITFPLSFIRFNYELGIVSFTDQEGKTWRFESWE